MSEPETLPPAPAETSPTPETAPAATAEAAPAPAAASTPATQPAAKPADKPADKRKPKRPQGGGGTPRRRMIEPIPGMDGDFKFGVGPKINELDAEIAGELEAALGGIGDILGGETSRQVRAEAAATTEQGRKKGKVHSIHGPDVFIDVPGGRSQGVMPMEQFPDGPPALGTEVEFSIEGYDGANGLLLLSRKWAAMQADWSSLAEGMIVEARVVETNKGGLTVDVNGIRGFLPISQVDLYRVEDAAQFVNQRLTCIVTEANPSERNLVLSRRALLEKQREENREKVWAELEVGQIRSGIVRNVKDFGAFVDLGGVDGFLHVSEMSWRRVTSATQVLQPGQTIKVAILKLDKESRKVSVGLKQLEPSPWDNIDDKYPHGTAVKGTVSRIAEFGAFVELEPGVEGLVHVSELSNRRVWRVKDVVQEGQEVEVKILGIDPDQRRISLSIRQAIAPVETKPADEEEADEPEAPVKPPRPHATPLRGGLGGGTLVFEEPDKAE